STSNRIEPVPSGPPYDPPPPLENGDHLTRAEFERRYEAMPNIKAELIDGVVYMASPVNHRKHGRPHSKLTGWLTFYVVGTPGVDYGSDSSLKLDAKNEPPQTLCYTCCLRTGGRHSLMKKVTSP